MTMCPNSKAACECQPQDGVMCPHGPTPDDWPRGTITLTMEQAKAVFEALDIGLGAAAQEAAQYHEAMKGYRPHRHQALDDDAAKVSAALTLMGQLIEGDTE